MNRRSRVRPIRRSGCLTCKNGHKRCDEQKPRCGRCARLNLECKAPELFRSSTSADSTIRRSSAQDPSFMDSIISFDAVDESSEPSDSPEPTLSPVSAPSISCVDIIQHPWSTFITDPRESHVERYLLHHYINKLSPVLVNVDTPSNPLRTVVIPRAAASSVLMDALHATSAFHIFACSRDAGFRTASLGYYNKAASGLHRLLMDESGLTSGSHLEILLLTAVFLCKYEIISGGVANWRSHLQGLQKMFSVSRSHRSAMAPETVSYIQSFIAYHSHIAGITRVEILPSPLVPSVDQQCDDSADRCDRIDPYMGISAKFISLLHLAAETLMLDFTKESNISIVMGNVLKIYYGIKETKQTLPTPGQIDEFSEDTVGPLDHIANAYKHALIVYLHNILQAAEKISQADDFISQCSHIRRLFGLDREDAISACMQDILSVPEDDCCVVGLVPVLFIVASETKNRTEFNVAITKLTAVLDIAGLANISSTLELFHKVQEASSANWRQIVKVCQWDLIVC